MMGLIEDLSLLSENSGDVKIVLCHFTELVQEGCTFKAGIQAVLEITR